MSISLNNHESRITALENRTSSGLSIVSSSLTTNGFIEFSNTLIVNWGINLGTRNGSDYNLPKAFKKVGLVAVGSPHVKPSEVYWTQPATAYINGLNKIRVGGHSSTGNVAWIAIGILYTYRYIIKSAQKFAPLSYLLTRRCRSMSISLNNHEDRIKALENGGAGSWSKGSNANGNWVKESKTGLLIQWGSISTSVSYTYEVDQPFPVKYTQIPVVNKSIGGRYDGGFDMSWMQIKSVSLDKFIHSVVGLLGSPVQWIAIGYLISDRILNYAYACKSLLFTPPRTMEV